MLSVIAIAEAARGLPATEVSVTGGLTDLCSYGTVGAALPDLIDPKVVWAESSKGFGLFCFRAIALGR